MPRLTPARRAARREQVLQAAIRAVIRSGFQGMTMADVIAESGLSAGAVYGYFASKNDLLVAVAETHLHGLEELVASRLSPDPPISPADLLELLIEQVRIMADQPEGDLTVVIVQIWGQAVLGGEVCDIMAPRVGLLYDTICDAARCWREHGMIAADADPEAVARVFTSLLPGYMLQRLVLGEIAPADYAAGLRAFDPGR